MKKIMIVNNEIKAHHLSWINKLMTSLFEVSNVVISLVHYQNINPKILLQENPSGVILSGREIDWDIEEIFNDYQNEMDLIKNANIPILGICAGLQLIGVSFGSTFGKIIDSPTNIREKGYVNISISNRDPVLATCHNEITCYELHRDELKTLPHNFTLLASTNMCKIQGIKHNYLPIWGVQFHPEMYTEDNPDGKQILSNFLSLCTTSK